MSDQSDLAPLRDISIEIVVPGPVVPNNAAAPAVPNNAADPQMNGQANQNPPLERLALLFGKYSFL